MCGFFSETQGAAAQHSQHIQAHVDRVWPAKELAHLIVHVINETTFQTALLLTYRTNTNMQNYN